MTELQLPVAYRNALPSDLPLILHSTIRCLAAQHPYGGLDSNFFAGGTKSLLLRLIPLSQIVCAVDPDFHSTVYGYCLGDQEESILHFLYVRSPYRRAGVGTALRNVMFGEDTLVSVTFATRQVRPLMDKWKLVYDSHRLLDVLKDSEDW